MRPVWSLTYRLVARVLAAYLRRGRRDSSVYALGSVAGSSVVPGVSDIDLAVVVEPRGRAGAQRAAVERRWNRRRGRFRALDALAYVAVYEGPELERAVAGSPCVTFGLDGPAPAIAADALSQPSPLVDPAALTTRPGLHRPLANWRLLAGIERRPAAPAPEPQQRRIAAWLELQYWWWYVFDACVAPEGPRKAYLSVKLAAEPVRVWQWLTRGDDPPDRREALSLGPEVFPEERGTFDRARELLDGLHRSPGAAISDFLPTFVRLTARVGERLEADVEEAGFTDVRLIDGDLALGPRAEDPLTALTSRRPRLHSLVDWRALARPALPDEALALIDASAADAVTLAAAAAAGRSGPYPALRDGGLLTLPTSVARRAVLRSVHCSVTDPVSFAVLEGAPLARFPNVSGWSIENIARRAVAEHRAWLRADGIEKRRDLAALGMLLSSARAALLLESVGDGAPELALTAGATARKLAVHDPRAASVAAEAYGEYRSCRASGGSPSPETVSAFRACVLRLPPYCHTSEGVPSPA